MSLENLPPESVSQIPAHRKVTPHSCLLENLGPLRISIGPKGSHCTNFTCLCLADAKIVNEKFGWLKRLL